MDILPILSTLRRHKVTATLIVLEIALTCAIVCNAVFLINQRLHRMDMQSGVAMHELVQVQVSTIGSQPDARARTQEDLAALRQVPGVQAATLVSQVPFTNSSWNSSIELAPTQTQPTLNATLYFGEDVPQVFGSRLVVGRYFGADEYVDFEVASNNPKAIPQSSLIVIITRALAERLWPGENPLGKTIYLGDSTPLRVVGVVASLIRPSLFGGDNTAQWSMILPLRMAVGQGASYVLRTAPANRRRVIYAAVAALKKLDPKRVVTQQRTLDDVRAEFFQGDRAMTGLLVGVIVALLLVTGLGIVGLASFWVSQRRRTIGVRRALGATRADILHYFQTENFLLATMGIAIGMALAYGINLFLMLHYELPRMPWLYFPVGAIALWLIGQLAVLGPALRASNVPPVVATRSV
ncbi:MAG: ABC transporter permease [Xanthomonadales bacterium]|nr:ABC transporter permease [Xanthomonadales bacterium]ODU93605.1 MAG: ABC transporter permease [Rhodanobacter sp. SCN 66-43]OJY86701.1 MAG: ABC transporter permease [Xanthomonadales bacterium 66-474]